MPPLSAHPIVMAAPGLALEQAVARKHRTYPALQWARRCKLVVFGVELGGRSPGGLTLLRLLARARARQRAPRCAQKALTCRWTALASMAALRAHAATLLELPAVAGIVVKKIRVLFSCKLYFAML